jgi:DNA-binding CsgD family transcriptional regulator
MTDGRTMGDASRAYRWNPASRLPGDFELAMLLAVPIVADDGTVVGVCGLEVSQMLFKLRYSPPSADCPGALVASTPAYDDTSIELTRSLLAGQSYLAPSDETLRPAGSIYGLRRWRGSEDFLGNVAEIRLYPKDSVNANQAWQVVALIPVEEAAAAAGFEQRATWMLAAVALAALAAGLVAVKRVLAPVNRGLSQIMAGNQVPTTNITEIDDLFAFLARLDAERDEAQVPPNTLVLDQVMEPISQAEFERRQLTLSRAEVAVFNLYLDGYDAKEVAELLCLSINTVKTHNRHIYQKLGVSSRRELMAHVRAQRQPAPAVRGVTAL